MNVIYVSKHHAGRVRFDNVPRTRRQQEFTIGRAIEIGLTDVGRIWRPPQFKFVDYDPPNLNIYLPPTGFALDAAIIYSGMVIATTPGVTHKRHSKQLSILKIIA